jgi:chaperonin GroES
MSRTHTTSVGPGTIDPKAAPVFKPIFGKVIVKLDNQPERRYGSLFLPQRGQDRSSIGTIHAVYEPTETVDGKIEPQVKVGDTVVFGQFTGTLMQIGADSFVICREHDLLTVIQFPGDKPNIDEIIPGEADSG